MIKCVLCSKELKQQSVDESYDYYRCTHSGSLAYSIYYDGKTKEIISQHLWLDGFFISANFLDMNDDIPIKSYDEDAAPSCTIRKGQSCIFRVDRSDHFKFNDAEDLMLSIKNYLVFS